MKKYKWEWHYNWISESVKCVNEEYLTKTKFLLKTRKHSYFENEKKNQWEKCIKKLKNIENETNWSQSLLINNSYEQIFKTKWNTNIWRREVI